MFIQVARMSEAEVWKEDFGEDPYVISRGEIKQLSADSSGSDVWWYSEDIDTVYMSAVMFEECFHRSLEPGAKPTRLIDCPNL